jgi:hypothetical protein
VSGHPNFKARKPTPFTTRQPPTKVTWVSIMNYITANWDCGDALGTTSGFSLIVPQGETGGWCFIGGRRTASAGTGWQRDFHITTRGYGYIDDV